MSLELISQSLVDINLFSELRRIEDALVKNHSVAEALAWCGENRGTLKKTKVSPRRDLVANDR
jgi:hypothetical protein